MRESYRVVLGCLVFILNIVVGVNKVVAVRPEDGPEYLTDGHAAGGVVRSMLSLGEVCPEYLKYADATLQWIMSVAEKDDQGRIYWYQSVSAPKGHPNHKVKPGAMSQTITLFLDACERTGKKEYGRTFLKGWQLNQRAGNGEFAEQCMQYARGAADFIAKNAVQTENGLKFPRIVYVKR